MKEKEYILKNKLPLMLAISTLMLFFANFFSPLWIVATIFVTVSFLFFDVNQIICALMYLLLFSRIGTAYVYSFGGALVVLLIKYCIEIKKKSKKVFFVPLVLSLLYILIFTFRYEQINSLGIEQGILIIALLFVAYFAFVYNKEINLGDCFKYLTLGIAASLVLGLVSLLFDNFSISVIYDDGIYKRLQLFCYHTNNLGIICLFSIAYFVQKLINCDIKDWKSLLCILFCVFVGIFTLSKTFLLGFAFIVFYFLVCCACRYKKQSIKYILSTIFIILIFGIVFNNVLVRVVDRFSAYIINGTLWDRLTTGRSDIWARYFEYISSSVLSMLFGYGLFNSMGLSAGPHNVFLHLIYRTGLIGFILLCVIIIFYYKNSETKLKLTLKNSLLIFLFVILGFVEMILSERFFMFLIFAVMLLRQNTENYK